MRPYVPPLEGRADLLRLDFNENTLGAPPKALEALRQAIGGSDVPCYPEYGATSALAAHFGVAPEQMVLTNGTDEALQLLIQAVTPPGGAVVIPTPTYAMARFYAEVIGAQVVEVPYANPDLRFPLLDVIEASRSAGVTYLANPNNPTGTLLALDDIARIAACGSLVIVDEAYFEFSGLTALGLIEPFRNVVVTRTFSKAFGLAGLRIGAILASPDLAAQLRKARSPYSVNALAVAAALGAVGDTDWVRAYAAESRASVAMLASELTALGHKVWPSTGNFVLFDGGPESARRIHDLREKHAVLVRDRSHDVPNAVRVTAGTLDQTRTFLEAWRATR
ncbi:MAG: pyridoxal phosphate-dependent aminotransferase [Fimbriimonadaceae bacterium]